MATILGLPRVAELNGLVMTVVWVIVVTASILVHELGHAFSARAFGADAQIELYSLGGRTSFTTSDELTHRQDALISLAGPILGFLLGGVAYLIRLTGVLPDNGIFQFLLRQLIWVNLGWGALNLLPLLPLDGGNILRSVLNIYTKGRGMRPTQMISIGVGIVCVLLAIYLKWLWAGFIAGWCVASTFQAIREQSKRLDDKRLWQRFEQIKQDNTEHLSIRTAQLSDLLDKAKSEELCSQLVEYLCWEYICEGKYDNASQCLTQMPASYQPSKQLIATVLYHTGRTREAIPILHQAIAEYL